MSIYWWYIASFRPITLLSILPIHWTVLIYSLAFILTFISTLSISLSLLLIHPCSLSFITVSLILLSISISYPLSILNILSYMFITIYIYYDSTIFILYTLSILLFVSLPLISTHFVYSIPTLSFICILSIYLSVNLIFHPSLSLISIIIHLST